MIHKTIDISVKDSQFHGRLITYFHDRSPKLLKTKRPVVLVCPGGGYGNTSDREAEPMALQFVAMGYHAAVLRYSVAPARFPEALLQLAQAVAILRQNATEWGIDTERIVLLGASAGGHLVASLGVFWNRPFLSERLCIPSEQIRPNGLILCYPVITSGEKGHQNSFVNLLGDDHLDPQKRTLVSLEMQVSSQTPPTFLWHTVTDQTVPVENSILFFQALCAAGVPAEMHIYPVGPHGLALATEESADPDRLRIQEECQTWLGLAQNWMKHTIETDSCKQEV